MKMQKKKKKIFTRIILNFCSVARRAAILLYISAKPELLPPPNFVCQPKRTICFGFLTLYNLANRVASSSLVGAASFG